MPHLISRHTFRPYSAALCITKLHPSPMQMSPLGDRLLVKPQEQESKTAGGILLTSGSGKSMQDALIGTGASRGQLGWQPSMDQ